MTDESIKLFNTLNELLDHIRRVEMDVNLLSKEMVLKIGSFLESQKIALPVEVIEALQLQDIISQQLSATCEAIENTQTYLKFHVNSLKEDTKMVGQNLSKLIEKLDSSLAEAKSKMESFRGKRDNNQDGVEFF